MVVITFITVRTIKTAPPRLVLPGGTARGPPPFTAPEQGGPVHVALSSALAPTHLGAVSLVDCYTSLSELGPCSYIAYVPFYLRVPLYCAVTARYTLSPYDLSLNFPLHYNIGPSIHSQNLLYVNYSIQS